MNTIDFPYINAIEVKDCFAYQDLGTIEIPPQNGKPFSHLILTGRNGSGKSTILKGIDKAIISIFTVESLEQLKLIIESFDDEKEKKNQVIENNILKVYSNNIFFKDVDNRKPAINPLQFLYVLLNAHRKLEKQEVKSATPMDDFEKNILEKPDGFIDKQLKQFLVNKKVNQAFAQIQNDKILVDSTSRFFTDFENILKRYSNDKELFLTFESQKYEFYINYSSGQKHTLEQSSDGLAAFLNLLINLFLRKDLIQTNLGDYTYDPPGIVLIDEPENHLHIAAQYEVMPMLTTLFPNVQFIVATHSPAVISSIKNTVVYDITSRESELDNMAGKGFTELMMTHFGLDNEFSPVGDEIINKVNRIIKENRGNKKATKELLSKVYEEEARYLSATLSLELESLILQNDL
jgi:predicted ATP-binding protein involved in virulence